MKIDSVKIKLLMAKQGLTQQALADICGISRQGLSTMLTRGSCSVVRLGMLAKGLGVDVTEIMKEE